MKLGIDLRIFQIGHQYRGIGSHISNLINEISALKRSEQPELVFFEYPDAESGIKVIEKSLPKLKSYEVRKVKPSIMGFPYLRREVISFKQRYIDKDAGIINDHDIDVLLSIDFNLGIPKNKPYKIVYISYDFIPWVLSEYYLPNYWQSRNEGLSVKKSLKNNLDKWLYFNKIKQAHQRAYKILSISEQTKKDAINILRINPTKIDTVYLGVTQSSNSSYKNTVECLDVNGDSRSIDTSKEDYIFFMGGADRRRKIDELVKAFDIVNQTKKTRLVLAGYDFRDIKNVPYNNGVAEILDSKYNNLVYFAGFVSLEERNSLYKNAIAYVFPSIYEGFGLPILEAMELKCPVVTYNNSSISEIGGDSALYASSIEDIARHINSLRDNNFRSKVIDKGIIKASKFTWKDTAKNTLKEISKLLD